MTGTASEARTRQGLNEALMKTVVKPVHNGLLTLVAAADTVELSGAAEDAQTTADPLFLLRYPMDIPTPERFPKLLAKTRQKRAQEAVHEHNGPDSSAVSPFPAVKRATVEVARVEAATGLMLGSQPDFPSHYDLHLQRFRFNGPSPRDAAFSGVSVDVLALQSPADAYQPLSAHGHNACTAQSDQVPLFGFPVTEAAPSPLPAAVAEPASRSRAPMMAPAYTCYPLCVRARPPRKSYTAGCCSPYLPYIYPTTPQILPRTQSGMCASCHPKPWSHSTAFASATWLPPPAAPHSAATTAAASPTAPLSCLYTTGAEAVEGPLLDASAASPKPCCPVMPLPSGLSPTESNSPVAATAAAMAVGLPREAMEEPAPDAASAAAAAVSASPFPIRCFRRTSGGGRPGWDSAVTEAPAEVLAGTQQPAPAPAQVQARERALSPQQQQQQHRLPCQQQPQQQRQDSSPATLCSGLSCALRVSAYQARAGSLYGTSSAPTALSGDLRPAAQGDAAGCGGGCGCCEQHPAGGTRSAAAAQPQSQPESPARPDEPPVGEGPQSQQAFPSLHATLPRVMHCCRPLTAPLWEPGPVPRSCSVPSSAARAFAYQPGLPLHSHAYSYPLPYYGFSRPYVHGWVYGSAPDYGETFQRQEGVKRRPGADPCGDAVQHSVPSAVEGGSGATPPRWGVGAAPVAPAARGHGCAAEAGEGDGVGEGTDESEPAPVLPVLPPRPGSVRRRLSWYWHPPVPPPLWQTHHQHLLSEQQPRGSLQWGDAGDGWWSAQGRWAPHPRQPRHHAYHHHHHHPYSRQPALLSNAPRTAAARAAADQDAAPRFVRHSYPPALPAAWILGSLGPDCDAVQMQAAAAAPWSSARSKQPVLPSASQGTAQHAAQLLLPPAVAPASSAASGDSTRCAGSGSRVEAGGKTQARPGGKAQRGLEGPASREVAAAQRPSAKAGLPACVLVAEMHDLQLRQ